MGIRSPHDMTILLFDFSNEMEARFAPALASEGFTVRVAAASEELRFNGEHSSVLMIATLQPGVHRFPRLRRLLSECAVPIIALAHHPNRVDSTVVLELGADEYLPCDCEARELVACVRAVLRRQDPSAANSSTLLDLEGLVVDRAAREVRCDGQTIGLTTTEFIILDLLMSAAGSTISREQLTKHLKVRGEPWLARSFDVHVSHLRGKLGSRGSFIKTVRGAGYQFCPTMPTDNIVADTS